MDRFQSRAAPLLLAAALSFARDDAC